MCVGDVSCVGLLRQKKQRREARKGSIRLEQSRRPTVYAEPPAGLMGRLSSEGVSHVAFYDSVAA